MERRDRSVPIPDLRTSLILFLILSLGSVGGATMLGDAMKEESGMGELVGVLVTFNTFIGAVQSLNFTFENLPETTRIPKFW